MRPVRLRRRAARSDTRCDSTARVTHELVTRLAAGIDRYPPQWRLRDRRGLLIEHQGDMVGRIELVECFEEVDQWYERD
jgi:hypothetical protein